MRNLQTTTRRPTVLPPVTTPRAGDDDELLATWQLFRDAVQRVESGMAASLANGGVESTGFHEALGALCTAPDHRLPMSDLAARAGLSSGGMTKLADRLVDRGLVSRHHSTTDRRVVFAEVTAAGVAEYGRGARIYAAALRRELGGLERGHLVALRAACARLVPGRPGTRVTAAGARRD